MGSPEDEEDRQESEGPQTAVIISQGFWMGKYEVTQGEYLEVMGNNPSWFNGIRQVWDEDSQESSASTVRWSSELGRCGRLLRGADGAGAVGGRIAPKRLSTADGSGVGVCMSGVDLDAVQLWG